MVHAAAAVAAVAVAVVAFAVAAAGTLATLGEGFPYLLYSGQILHRVHLGMHATIPRSPLKQWRLPTFHSHL